MRIRLEKIQCGRWLVSIKEDPHSMVVISLVKGDGF